MKIRTRILLGMLIVVGLGFGFLLDWIIEDLKPQYRKTTEEPLVDTAYILAELAAEHVLDGEVNIQNFQRAFDRVRERRLSVQIFDFEKTRIEFHVYITDRVGRVIFDSDLGKAVGEDYSQWRDVNRTLGGEYGARTSDDPTSAIPSSIMYVAAPIELDGELVGVLSVGKPTRNSNLFLLRSRKRILVGGIVCAVAIVLVGLLLSNAVVNPIRKLTTYARALTSGERAVLPELGSGEIAELGVAFEQMRDALEGKQYIEKYVQTLTHEMKSPIAAIKGAVELLAEDMSTEQRKRFVANIGTEANRLGSFVERLLLLAALENRKTVENVDQLDLVSIVRDVCESIEPVLKSRGIELSVSGADQVVCLGERFLLRQAVLNLVQNAIDFSVERPAICVIVTSDRDGEMQYATIAVQDNGVGIPGYAEQRVFERFYSLARPDTGQKSSGLGLSFVREVALLHGGDVRLENLVQGGVRAVMRIKQSRLTI